MKLKAVPAPAISSVQWLPAERLGQLKVDAMLRPWLIAKGLLSVRLRDACGESFRLRLVDEWTGLLTGSQQGGLRSEDRAGLFREVEMLAGEDAWVFAQTVIPDSTLCRHAWLAELGDAALDATMDELSGVERMPYEYAWLPGGEPLVARALRDAEVRPAGLWARRSRVSLHRAPILIQEVFLPALSRV